MAAPLPRPEPAPRELSRAEARALFEEAAQRTMGMSGEEFLRRWDAGEFDGVADDPDHWAALHLVMLRPFAQ